MKKFNVVAFAILGVFVVVVACVAAVASAFRWRCDPMRGPVLDGAGLLAFVQGAAVKDKSACRQWSLACSDGTFTQQDDHGEEFRTPSAARAEWAKRYKLHQSGAWKCTQLGPKAPRMGTDPENRQESGPDSCRRWVVDCSKGPPDEDGGAAEAASLGGAFVDAAAAKEAWAGECTFTCHPKTGATTTATPGKLDARDKGLCRRWTSLSQSCDPSDRPSAEKGPSGGVGADFEMLGDAQAAWDAKCTFDCASKGHVRPGRTAASRAADCAQWSPECSKRGQTDTTQPFRMLEDANAQWKADCTFSCDAASGVVPGGGAHDIARVADCDKWGTACDSASPVRGAGTAGHSMLDDATRAQKEQCTFRCDADSGVQPDGPFPMSRKNECRKWLTGCDKPEPSLGVDPGDAPGVTYSMIDDAKAQWKTACTFRCDSAGGPQANGSLPNTKRNECRKWLTGCDKPEPSLGVDPGDTPGVTYSLIDDAKAQWKTACTFRCDSADGPQANGPLPNTKRNECRKWLTGCDKPEPSLGVDPGDTPGVTHSMIDDAKAQWKNNCTFRCDSMGGPQANGPLPNTRRNECRKWITGCDKPEPSLGVDPGDTPGVTYSMIGDAKAQWNTACTFRCDSADGPQADGPLEASKRPLCKKWLTGCDKPEPSLDVDPGDTPGVTYSMFDDAKAKWKADCTFGCTADGPKPGLGDLRSESDCQRFKIDCAANAGDSAGEGQEQPFRTRAEAQAAWKAKCSPELFSDLGTPPGLIIEKLNRDVPSVASPPDPPNYAGAKGVTCKVPTRPRGGAAGGDTETHARFYWVLGVCGGRADDPNTRSDRCRQPACTLSAPRDRCATCGTNWPSSLALHYMVGLQRTPEGTWKFVRSGSVVAPAGKVVVFKTLLDAELAAVVPGLRTWRAQTWAARLRECGAPADVCSGLDEACVDSKPTTWVVPVYAPYDEASQTVGEVVGASLDVCYDMLRLFVGQGDFQGKFSPLDVLTATESDPHGCPGFGPPGWMWVYCCHNGAVPHPAGGGDRVPGAHALMAVNGARANLGTEAGSSVLPPDQTRCADVGPFAGSFTVIGSPVWKAGLDTRVDASRMYMDSAHSSRCFGLENNTYAGKSVADTPLGEFFRPPSGPDASLFFRTRGMADKPVVHCVLFDAFGLHVFRWFAGALGSDHAYVAPWPASGRLAPAVIAQVERGSVNPVPRTDAAVDWYAGNSPEAVDHPAWISYPGVVNVNGLQNTGLACGTCSGGRIDHGLGDVQCNGGPPSTCWWDNMQKLVAPWPPNFQDGGAFKTACEADAGCKAFYDRQQVSSKAGTSMGLPEEAWKQGSPIPSLQLNLYGAAVSGLTAPPKSGPECTLTGQPSCSDCCVSTWRSTDRGTDGSAGTWTPVDYACNPIAPGAPLPAGWDPRSCPDAKFA